MQIFKKDLFVKHVIFVFVNIFDAFLLFKVYVTCSSTTRIIMRLNNYYLYEAGAQHKRQHVDINFHG